MRISSLLVPAALFAQAAAVHWVSSAERPPALPNLDDFPTRFGQWQILNEDPVAADIRSLLQADRIISRTYTNPSDQGRAGLFVAWFQTQNHGARQPHSPQVCLPGSGWTPTVTDEVRIPLPGDGESVTATRYVVAQRGQLAVVLYWYQFAHGAVSNEWSSKVGTVWEAIRYQRTDIALVRLITWPQGSDPAQATADAIAFAQAMQPQLRAALPR